MPGRSARRISILSTEAVVRLQQMLSRILARRAQIRHGGWKCTSPPGGGDVGLFSGSLEWIVRPDQSSILTPSLLGVIHFLPSFSVTTPVTLPLIVEPLVQKALW
jgi:hypothetical protein